MNCLPSWIIWIIKNSIPYIAIVIALFSLWYVRKQSQFGAINAEIQWHEAEKEYYFEDERVRRWEDSKNLIRDGIIPKSKQEFKKELDRLNAPRDIKDAYERRWRAWELLRKLSEAYRPFSPRFVSIDLSLPSHPALPAGKLLPITDISINELDCEFAGIQARCGVLIRSGLLTIPEELFSPRGMFAFSDQIKVKFPFSIHESPSGLVFDTTIYGKDGKPVIKITKNKWNISDPSLTYQYDIRRLEVIGSDGIPVFRIHVDNVNKVLHIGGRFITESGKMIALFPEKMVTDSFVLEGLELRPGGLHIKSMRKIKKTEMAKELQDLTPWFYYEKLE